MLCGEGGLGDVGMYDCMTVAWHDICYTFWIEKEQISIDIDTKTSLKRNGSILLLHRSLRYSVQSLRL